MKRFAIVLALALGLMVVGTVQAAPKGGGAKGGSSNGGGQQGGFRALPLQGNGNASTPINKQVTTLPKNVIPTTPLQKNITQTTQSKQIVQKNLVPAQGHQQYLAKHAKQYSFGFCYHGGHHCHWTYSCWCPHYGCYTYWCPYVCCYYYWCAPHCCYYPVSYCPTGIYAY